MVVGKLSTKLPYGILTDNGIKIEKHSKAGKQFHKKNHQPKSKMDQLDKSLSNMLGTKWDVVVNVRFTIKIVITFFGHKSSIVEKSRDRSKKAPYC